jgi:hypothetical protein
MKNLYLKFLLLCFATSAFSQNYHPLIKPSKYWDVMYHDNSICGYASGGRYFFDGTDTLINGQIYQVIKAYPIISLNQGPYCPPFAVNASIAGSNNSHLIREDTVTQRIYVLKTQTNTEDLLYDFTLLSGDTLHSQYAGMGMQLVVISVSTDTLFNGDVRKVIYLDNGEFYIESIGGSKGGFFMPIVRGIGFDYITHCVIENETIIYGGDCAPLVGINEFESSHLFRIFPNPSIGIYYLDFDISVLNVSLEIYNCLGVLLFTTNELNPQNFKLDLSEHTPGIYFCKINSGNHQYLTKLIKQ